MTPELSPAINGPITASDRVRFGNEANAEKLEEEPRGMRDRPPPDQQ